MRLSSLSVKLSSVPVDQPKSSCFRKDSRAARPAWMLCVFGCLAAAFGPATGSSRAQEVEELDAAGRAAKKQLETSQAAAARELQELEGRIAEETKAITALRESQGKLAEKLKGLEQEDRTVEEKAQALAQAKQAEALKDDAARAELHRQLLKLKDRLYGSVVTAQDEQLLDAALNLRATNRQSLSEQVPVLFEIYERVLGYAQTAAIVQLPVRIAEDADRIENLKVLRLGLLGGYFSRPAAKSGGFVFADPTAKSGFVAESRGLSSNQKNAIITLLQKPDKGGFLPMDVTLGASLSSLPSSDSLAAWLRRGGWWVYAVLGLGAIAVVIALERGVFLVLKLLSARKGRKRLAGMLRSGRIVSAESAHLNGAAGSLLQAAAESTSRGRAAMEAATQETLLRQEEGLQKRLGWIWICGSTAAFLGLLGTLAGLAGALRLAGAEGVESQALLTGGIAEALIATQVGLAVGALCLVLRGVLGELAESVRTTLHSAALSVLSLPLSSGEVAPHHGVGARV